MATVAILGDGLVIRGGVRAVMATETPGKIHVTEIVRIGAPGNLQIRENVAVINCKNGPASLQDIFRTMCVEVGIVLLIKTREPRWQFRGRIRTCRIVHLQQLQTRLLDVGQRDRDITKSERFVHRSFGQVEGMRGAVMTVHAFHVELWKCRGRIRRRFRSDKVPDLSCLGIPVFDPRNGLPLRVGRCKTDVNSWTKVCTVNSGDPASTDQHQENGCRPGVGFVVGILAEYAQTHTTGLLWPMAVLAGLSGGHETISLQSGRNRLRTGLEHGFNELPNSARFAAEPTGCAWRYMTLDTFHPCVRRILIGCQFRVHRMTRRSAELWRLHVLDGAIGDLG